MQPQASGQQLIARQLPRQARIPNSLRCGHPLPPPASAIPPRRPRLFCRGPLRACSQDAPRVYSLAAPRVEKGSRHRPDRPRRASNWKRRFHASPRHHRNPLTRYSGTPYPAEAEGEGSGERRWSAASSRTPSWAPASRARAATVASRRWGAVLGGWARRCRPLGRTPDARSHKRLTKTKEALSSPPTRLHICTSALLLP